jgi:hypothetical protein
LQLVLRGVFLQESVLQALDFKGEVLCY